MYYYAVQDSEGNTWRGIASDLDGAQESAIDAWESACIVFGDIVRIERLAQV